MITAEGRWCKRGRMRQFQKGGSLESLAEMEEAAGSESKQARDAPGKAQVGDGQVAGRRGKDTARLSESGRRCG